MITVDNVRSVTPEDMLRELRVNYTYTVPNGINTILEMNQAGILLGRLTNSYSYVMSLLTEVSLCAKMLKSNIPPKPKVNSPQEELEKYNLMKEAYDVMMMRKNILQDFADTLKFQYSCVSREITVKLKRDEEMNMSESRGA